MLNKIILSIRTQA